jgi:N-acetylmuramic acid 6-phosphate etherase
MSSDAGRPLTEQHNPRSENIDALSAREIVAVFADEDRQAVAATVAVAAQIAVAAEWVADALRRGGRLLYIGAGTSGRLGVLDASECPPTFGADPTSVVGIIAGGDGALRKSADGAEDDEDAGAAAIAGQRVNAADVVVGIAASGRTPYVLAALREARGRGAKTVLLACSPPEDDVRSHVDLFITPLVGPEIVSGSTRMKAGTATKLALNQITTTAMILCGKVYGNRMVDVKPVNAKLRRRAIGLVLELGGVSEAQAAATLDEAGGDVKVAVVVLRRSVAVAEAMRIVARADGLLRQALDDPR